MNIKNSRQGVNILIVNTFLQPSIWAIALHICDKKIAHNTARNGNKGR
jgi:hypothetical protein